MLDPIRLLEDAAAATKLSDFGDPSFREGLDRLADSLNGEAALSPLGTAMAEAAMPGFRALHYDPPDAPMECVMLLNHAFNSSALWTTFFVPIYMAWTLEADPTPAYAYHERMLKLLQSRHPGRWSLKAPQHAVTLEALRARYPDLKLIVTHREPTVCAASTMSLTAFPHGKTGTRPRPLESARFVADFIDRYCNGLLEDARRHGDDSMIHVPYPELVADPMGVVQRIAAAADHELTPAACRAIEAQIAGRSQHRFGVHRYALEDYGFRREKLDERFAGYRQHFGVELWFEEARQALPLRRSPDPNSSFAIPRTRPHSALKS